MRGLSQDRDVEPPTRVCARRSGNLGQRMQQHACADDADRTARFGLAVRVGDHVRLTTRDGRQHDLTLQSIDSTALVATEGTRYDMREIQSVERRQFSGIKTAILVGGLTAGVLLIIIAAAEAALVGGIQ